MGGRSGKLAALNGFSENLGFDGQILTDAVNPVNNQFNSVSNALTPDTTWGVDIDTYDVTNYLHSGDTVATSVYSSGGDAVWLSCEVISVSDTSNSDMSITKMPHRSQRSIQRRSHRRRSYTVHAHSCE